MQYSRVLPLLVATCLCGGCRSASQPLESARAAAQSTSYEQLAPAGQAAASQPDTLASPTLACQPLPQAPEPSTRQVSHEEIMLAHHELSLENLTDAVLSRNQSLQAMVSAWRAATQRYPQAVSLEDPMFESALAPASIGSDEVSTGYMLGGSQQLPWFGKRRLRGQQALAEASAAMNDVADVRLQLIQATQLAFYDYYLAQRQSELNARNIQSLRDFREDARRRYEAALVTQQDVLQADVELAMLDRRQVELERNRRVAMARINTLLHRAADTPLPPPPASLPDLEELPPADQLRGLALANRPDLAALAARVQADQAALGLAYKDYLPDIEVMGRYDTFWQEEPLRAMVGINANLPVYRQRLNAAVCEATFRISQRRAEYRQRIDDINREVQTTYAELQAAQELVELYAQRILPAAQQNVESARAGYIAGRVDFLRLIEAERQLISLLQDEQDLTANYHAQRAEMERVIGAPLPSATERDPWQLPLP